jgi:hypothetical protein
MQYVAALLLNVVFSFRDTAEAELYAKALTEKTSDLIAKMAFYCSIYLFLKMLVFFHDFVYNISARYEM